LQPFTTFDGTSHGQSPVVERLLSRFRQPRSAHSRKAQEISTLGSAIQGNDDCKNEVLTQKALRLRTRLHSTWTFGSFPP
jgi:hypothetical protein